MPSPPILPVDALLAPIAGGNPAGRRMSLPESNKLKEYREDFDPDRDLSEEDRRNPRYAEKQKVVPQWDKVVQFGTQFLADTGKDLPVALAMVEALVKRAKFAGLRDGLKLLRGLCGQCWDRMHPTIGDPDDPEEVEGRVGQFVLIDDELKNPFLPTTVRSVALLTTAAGEPISYLSCQSFDAKKKPKVSRDDFRAAVAAAGPEQVAVLRLMDEDIAQSLAELEALVAVLDAKAGKNAPGLGGLRKALLDCQTMTQEAVRLRGGTPAVVPAEVPVDQPSAAAPEVPAPAAVNLGAIRSRDDLYNKLNELTGLLEQFEPHSPVPFMIRRAMEMRDMKFPELVDRLNSATKLLDFIRNPLTEQES